MLFLFSFSSCKKWEDKKGTLNGQLANRKYCNNPNAVNYNWNFPGTEDSTSCLFPTDFFTGNYIFIDSVYSSNNKFLFQATKNIQILPLSMYKIALMGWCNATDSIYFTVGKNLYASIDSVKVRGQLLCRQQDTITGIMNHNTDITNKEVHINFTVVSDTGVTLHWGRALKQ